MRPYLEKKKSQKVGWWSCSRWKPCVQTPVPQKRELSQEYMCTDGQPYSVSYFFLAVTKISERTL
jgi:hypothetical protein